MIINIVAAGPNDALPDLRFYDSEGTKWLGVDRGVYKLITEGISPSYAFGDFDSVTAEELQVIEKNIKNINKYVSEKDETDLELALNWALRQNVKRIRLFGVTGGRLDHLLANVFLLVKASENNEKVQIEIIDKNNLAFVKRAGSYSLKIDQEKKYVSFIPITSTVEGLTLTGFKYQINNHHLDFSSTLCVSNELISNEGNFSFSSGILLVIRSSD